MKLRLPSIFAILAALALVAACGGPAEPPAPEVEEPTAAAPLGEGGADNVGESAADAADAADAGTVVDSAGRFTLGTHYGRLSPTQRTMTSNATSIEVVEAFWYGCGHCNAAEPFFQRWLETKPDYVTFVRLPVTWDRTTVFHARVHYTAKALDKIDEMHEAIFQEIHGNGNPLLSEAALVEFFGRFGVSQVQFEEAWNSPSVTEVELARANEYMRRYEIGSVPSIIVNGKYTSGATEAGGYDALVELINELVAAERSGQ